MQRTLALAVFAAGCVNSPSNPLADLSNAADGPTLVDHGETSRHVSTRIYVAGSSPEERARRFLDEFGPVVVDESLDLDVRDVDEDDDGDAIVVFDVSHDGVPIYGSEIRVAVDRDGNVYYAGGNVPEDLEDLGSATLTPYEARSAFRAAYPRSFIQGEPTLVVFNPGLFYGAATRSHLAYQIDAFGFGVDGSVRAFVDAHRGYVIVAIPRTHQGRDRTVGDFGHLAFDTPLEDVPVHYEEAGPVVEPPSDDASAAFMHAGVIYDFFNDEFGRDSLDGAGLPLNLYVSYPAYNAYWDGNRSAMLFGSGFVTLDIAAHEMTHGVVQHSAALEYWMEAGALNESMADVFAGYVDTGSPWELALESGRVFRSLSNPMSNGLPIHTDHAYAPPVRGSCTDVGDCTGSERCVGGECMLDDRFSDHGGVHVNSSIPNHIAYLFTEGGTHAISGISVDGIGRERSMHVVYGALTKYLGRSSGFSDYRVAARQSALDLIEGRTTGADLDYEHCGAVLNAFAAAGIGSEDTDADCFADDVDNCPCVYNPEQNPDDCGASPDDACLEPECLSDAACVIEALGDPSASDWTCSEAGHCVLVDLPDWDCSGPGDCADGHCDASRQCGDPCEQLRECGTCDADDRCGWCAEGGCHADAGECSAGEFAACEVECTEDECPADSCEAHGDSCEVCNAETGCGWCEGTGCVSNANEASCTTQWLDSPSQCDPCDFADCGTCATSGYCAWCPGIGCVNDSLTMCDDKRPNPSDCG